MVVKHRGTMSQIISYKDGPQFKDKKVLAGKP